MKQRMTALALSFALVAMAVPVQAQVEGDARDEVAAKEGSPITFYGHVLAHGRGSPVPMNTQFPEGADDYSLGTFGNCGTYNGVPAYLFSGGPAGTALGGGTDGPCDPYGGNENWWFTTPGFVQIKNREAFNYEDLHNERGQTKDIFFDLEQPIEASVFMSADFHAWSTLFCSASMCWNWDPGYIEDWVVETTVYSVSLGELGSAASEAPDMGAVYATGDENIIAYGRDGPKPISSFDPTLQPVAGPLCDGPCETVNEFNPVLEYTDAFIQAGGVVPKENDIVVRHQWYQETNGERYILGIGLVVGTAWNLNGGEDHPANIVFPIKNPLDVELVFPRFIHDKLVILSVLNTPWGSYDIDLDSIKLEVTDSNGQSVDIDPDTIRHDLDVSVAHSGHYNPIDITWVWDYQDQGLPPGEYTATVSAINFQGSYDTFTEATFEITDDGTGGATSYGTEGLLSFTDNQLEQYSEGSQSQVDSEGSEEAEPDAVSNESEDSPAVPILAAIAALAAIAVARRRQG